MCTHADLREYARKQAWCQWCAAVYVFYLCLCACMQASENWQASVCVYKCVCVRVCAHAYAAHNVFARRIRTKRTTHKARLLRVPCMQVWSDVAGTEIPALRQMVHSQTLARRRANIRKQVSTCNTALVAAAACCGCQAASWRPGSVVAAGHMPCLMECIRI